MFFQPFVGAFSLSIMLVLIFLHKSAILEAVALKALDLVLDWSIHMKRQRFTRLFLDGYQAKTLFLQIIKGGNLAISNISK